MTPDQEKALRAELARALQGRDDSERLFKEERKLTDSLRAALAAAQGALRRLRGVVCIHEPGAGAVLRQIDAALNTSGKPGGPPCTSFPATSASKDRLDVSLSAWPIPDVLERLADAADHLRGDHSCDAEGHEGVLYAAQAARAHAMNLRSGKPGGEAQAGERYVLTDGGYSALEDTEPRAPAPPEGHPAPEGEVLLGRTCPVCHDEVTAANVKRHVLIKNLEGGGYVFLCAAQTHAPAPGAVEQRKGEE
jgi:hypothetical protein